MPTLRGEQRLEEALGELARHGGAGLPVADAAGGLSAWITHRDLLRTAAGVTRHDHVPPATRPRRRR